MLPLDLVIALTPALLVACLWLKDALARRLGKARIERVWHEARAGGE